MIVRCAVNLQWGIPRTTNSQDPLAIESRVQDVAVFQTGLTVLGKHRHRRARAATAPAAPDLPAFAAAGFAVFPSEASTLPASDLLPSGLMQVQPREPDPRAAGLPRPKGYPGGPGCRAPGSSRCIVDSAAVPMFLAVPLNLV